MARRKNPDNTRHLHIARYTTICLAWAAWLFIALSCVSFNANDRTWGITNPNNYYSGQHANQNWCGPAGAATAWVLLGQVGPGMYVALILAAVGLFLWTRGEAITQWPLRLTGGLMLVAVVSSLFWLMNTTRGVPALPGGVLGLAIGEFLHGRFALAGTLLIELLALIISLLLVADDFMLALPGHMIAAWERMPRKQLAGAAAGAVGTLRENISDLWDHLSHRNRMGKVGPITRKTKNKPADGPIINGNKPPAPAATEVKKPSETAAKADVPGTSAASASALTGAAVPSVDDGEDDVPPAISEPVIRKAVAPKATNLPLLKPQAAHKQDLGNYRLPGLELLDEAEPSNPAGQEAFVREKSKVLETTLTSYNIDAKVAAIDTGPVLTLYELSLAPGIKSSNVGALSKDIARALMSPPVRIIDNIPGKDTMGIEVPNMNRERVRLKELMQLGSDNINRMQLPMCLGKDASGNPLIEDLTRMPHLLIAGTTGSGKSVCINSIIMTLLLTQRPDHVKMIMVDPKMVEMQDYKAIPHLIAPIIDDMSKAESILEWATQKMDERYETLSEAGVRHIREFNKLTREQIIERFQANTEDDQAKLCFHMPYIVIIIDELADLMMTSKDVEGHIVRIAQKARAVGIHLILSTQRPEAQVVTGLIKSNMPGRLCFQVRSRLDSRIMLDQSGGELLLGQGDLLMLKPTGGSLVRGQGAFVDDNEMKRVCKFLKEIAEPEFHPELMQLGQAAGLGDEEKDPLYNDAVDIMIESGRGSVSLVQRRLNIGYSRASRLIDQMRRTGIVGAYKGSMASEVTVTKDEWEAMKAAEANAATNGLDQNGDPGATGDETGAGQSAGFAQQVNSTFQDPDAKEDEDDEAVPNELPGEHRM